MTHKRRADKTRIMGKPMHVTIGFVMCDARVRACVTMKNGAIDIVHHAMTSIHVWSLLTVNSA